MGGKGSSQLHKELHTAVLSRHSFKNLWFCLDRIDMYNTM